MKIKKEEIKYTQHTIKMTPNEVQTVRDFLNIVDDIYAFEGNEVCWNDVVDFINGEVEYLDFPQNEIRFEIEG